MAPRVFINKNNGGRVVIHSVSNVSLTIVGNNSVSNIAIGTENVVGAYINKVWWGANGASNTGIWQVQRGANNILFLNNIGGGGHLDFEEKGCSISLDSTATLVANCADASSWIMLEIEKIISANGADGQY